MYSFKVQNLIRNFYEILFFIKYQKYFARLLLLWMTIITLNKIRITMNLLHEICQSFEIQRRSLTFLKRREVEEWNIPFCYFWICKNRKDLKLRKKSSCVFWIVFHQHCLGKFIDWRKTKNLKILHRDNKRFLLTDKTIKLHFYFSFLIKIKVCKVFTM